MTDWLGLRVRIAPPDLVRGGCVCMRVKSGRSWKRRERQGAGFRGRKGVEEKEIKGVAKEVERRRKGLWEEKGERDKGGRGEG